MERFYCDSTLPLVPEDNITLAYITYNLPLVVFVTLAVTPKTYPCISTLWWFGLYPKEKDTHIISMGFLLTKIVFVLPMGI